MFDGRGGGGAIKGSIEQSRNSMPRHQRHKRKTQKNLSLLFWRHLCKPHDVEQKTNPLFDSRKKRSYVCIAITIKLKESKDND